MLPPNGRQIGGSVEGTSAHVGTTPSAESGERELDGVWIDVKEEILRLDAIANTVFEICIAVAAAAVTVMFAARSEVAQIGAGVVGVVVGVLALIAAPEVVFGFNRRTMRGYMKKRRKRTELAIVGLFMLVYLGLALGVAYLVGDVTDDALPGIVVGVAALIGVAGIVKLSWNDLWPPELRGADEPQP